MLQILGQKGINDLWVEAGPRLAGALLQAALVDELILYLAPKLMGDQARGLLALPEFVSMAQVPTLTLSVITSYSIHYTKLYD